MFFLCFLAVAAAIGGLATVGLALGPMAGMTATALLTATVFGAASLISGLAAAAMAMRRGGPV